VLLLTRVATAAASATLTCGSGHTGRYPGTRSFVLTATLVVVLTSDVRETIVRIAVFTCQMCNSCVTYVNAGENVGLRERQTMVHINMQ
jgi:hypothetical protein